MMYNPIFLQVLERFVDFGNISKYYQIIYCWNFEFSLFDYLYTKSESLLVIVMSRSIYLCLLLTNKNNP